MDKQQELGMIIVSQLSPQQFAAVWAYIQLQGGNAYAMALRETVPRGLQPGMFHNMPTESISADDFSDILVGYRLVMQDFLSSKPSPDDWTRVLSRGMALEKSYARFLVDRHIATPDTNLRGAALSFFSFLPDYGGSVVRGVMGALADLTQQMLPNALLNRSDDVLNEVRLVGHTIRTDVLKRTILSRAEIVVEQTSTQTTTTDGKPADSLSRAQALDYAAAVAEALTGAGAGLYIGQLLGSRLGPIGRQYGGYIGGALGGAISSLPNLLSDGGGAGAPNAPPPAFPGEANDVHMRALAEAGDLDLTTLYGDDSSGQVEVDDPEVYDSDAQGIVMPELGNLIVYPYQEMGDPLLPLSVRRQCIEALAEVIDLLDEAERGDILKFTGKLANRVTEAAAPALGAVGATYGAALGTFLGGPGTGTAMGAAGGYALGKAAQRGIEANAARNARRAMQRTAPTRSAAPTRLADRMLNSRDALVMDVARAPIHIARTFPKSNEIQPAARLLDLWMRKKGNVTLNDVLATIQ